MGEMGGVDRGNRDGDIKVDGGADGGRTHPATNIDTNMETEVQPLDETDGLALRAGAEEPDAAGQQRQRRLRTQE